MIIQTIKMQTLVLLKVCERKAVYHVRLENCIFLVRHEMVNHICHVGSLSNQARWQWESIMKTWYKKTVMMEDTLILE